MRPTTICKTIACDNDDAFDEAVSKELNHTVWDGFSYVIHFDSDDNSHIAHIIFTEITDKVTL